MSTIKIDPVGINRLSRGLDDAKKSASHKVSRGLEMMAANAHSADGDGNQLNPLGILNSASANAVGLLGDVAAMAANAVAARTAYFETESVSADGLTFVPVSSADGAHSVDSAREVQD